MLTTGMDIETVRTQFDIPRLTSFNKYTEKYPPQHILIASYFGFGKDKPKAEDNDIAELLSQIPQRQINE